MIRLLASLWRRAVDAVLPPPVGLAVCITCGDAEHARAAPGLGWRHGSVHEEIGWTHGWLCLPCQGGNLLRPGARA